MDGYTVKNLKAIEDQAPKFGLAPGLEARFARQALEGEQTGLSYQRLEPNFRIPFGHKHAGQEEIYVVVSGSGRMKLDDEVVEVEQWDAVRVASGTMRGFEAGPDGVELLAFGAPTEGKPNDAEMEQDWWSDGAG
jgi:mannose-6-phosphate isomerase-like protein (cupin superfamily)